VAFVPVLSVVCAQCGEQNSELGVCCSACGSTLPSETIAPDPDETQPSAPRPFLPLVRDPRIGQSIGQYTILGVLGRGGMGVVYRARDDKRRRDVALKFLSAALVADAQAKARFVREARVLSALDHPNVGSIYELSEHEGHPFLALALYEGETLKDAIARGPLPMADAVRVVQRIAAGLAAAHDAGIVHRDVKPANVILTSSTQIKLLDFGIAKLLDPPTGSSVLTQGGVVLGTLAYAAPEQIVGEPVDHRSDLWSLGVIAYEAVTGTPPFHAKRRSVIASRIFADEPTPPKQLRPDIPEALTAIIHGLLRKVPDERIQRAAEVVARLIELCSSVQPGDSIRPRSGAR